MMDERQKRKLFVGGITWEFNKDVLEEYFGKYGQVEECVIVLDKITRQPRDFGFVTFTDLFVVETVLKENHSIAGIKIEVKPSEPRREKNQFNQGHQHTQHQEHYIPKKIFVGGLPDDLTEEEFIDYYAKFGAVNAGIIMCDKKTKSPKGFGFITFESDESVVHVLDEQQNQPQKLKEKQVKVTRARAEYKRNEKRNWNGYDQYEIQGLQLRFDDLAFGVDHLFCYYCGGAYGHQHSPECSYHPNPYNGVWNSIWVTHPSLIQW